MAKFSDVHDAADHTGLTGVVDGIPKTLLDAKGDLIAASAADTAAKVTVGSNGSFLRAASGQSAGLEWQLNNFGASTAPGTGDDSGDGYSVGSRWIDTTADKEYVCLDASVGAAVWTETTGGGGSVATDAIWDAAGDLAVGSGANTAAKLAAGSEGEVLTIASGVPSWEAASGGSGQAPSAAIDRWHQSAYASTTSHDTTITAADAGQRIIFVVGSYGRDVNTPTCTNVTFTEVLGANNSTTTYLSVYVGVVAGGSSGTTINVTATGTNVIFATAVIIDDAVTPTAVDTASATTANGAMAVDCSVGDLIIMGWATDNATIADFTPLPLVANTPLFLLPFHSGDNLTGLGVAVGLATITHIVGYFGRGGNGNQVGGLVAVS